MKNIILMALIYCAFATDSVYAADQSLRVDLVTMSADAQLSPLQAPPGFVLEYPPWDAKKNQRRLWLVGPQLEDKQWHEFEFLFTVNKNTRALLRFSWMRSKQKGIEAYGAIKNLNASGVTLKNGEFKNNAQFWDRQTPLTAKIADYPYVLLSQTSNLSQEIDLKAGETIAIRGMYRLADKDDIDLNPEPSEVTLTTQEWELNLNRQTGVLNSIYYKGQLIYSASADSLLPLVDFRLENNQSYFSTGDVRFENYHFDSENGLLSLFFSSPEWRLAEKIQLDHNKVPGLLALSAEISNQSTKRIKFRNVFYNHQLPSEGEYLYPGTFFNDKTGPFGDFRTVSQSPLERKGVFRDLYKMKGFKTLPYCPVILLKPEKSLCQIYLMEKKYDSSNIFLRNTKDRLLAETRINCCGWCEPGQKQVFDALFIKAVPGDLQEALQNGISQLYRELNWTVPSNRPDWVPDISLCGSEMDRFNMTTFQDFVKYDLKRIKKMGFNTLWLLPVHEGPVNYVPSNFFATEPSYGTWQEYRSLVEAMNQNGIRIIQDIVPHGGKVPAPLTQYVFGETGYMLGGRAVDYNDPKWIECMRNVAAFYCDLGVSGLRVDAPGGSGMPNWRTRGFPNQRPLMVDFGNRFRVPEGTTRQIDLQAWENCLQENNGVLPPLSYDRASMSGLHGGRHISRGIRLSAQEKHPGNMTLLETHGFPFTMEGDLTYDMLSVGLIDKLRMMPAHDFVPGLVQWLQDQEWSDVENALLMRYVSNYDNPASCPAYLYNPYRAIIALTFFSKGIPQVFLEKTDGHGFFLRRLNQIRAALPELRWGSAQYEVLSSAPGVLKILRTNQHDCSLVLINFSPDKQLAAFVPPAELRSSALTDVFAQKKVTSDQGGRIQYELSPWDIAVITNREIKVDQEPVPREHTASSRPSLQGKTVETKAYSAEFAEDGTISCLKNAEGKTLLNHSDLLFSGETTGSIKPKFSSNEIPDGICLVFDYVTPQQKAFTMTYRCFADHIEINAYSEASDTSVKLYSSSLENYQINTCFGQALDWIESMNGPRELKTLYPRMSRSRFPKDPFLLWSSRLAPLDLNNPELFFFHQVGSLKIMDEKCNAELSLWSQFTNEPGLNLLWDIPVKQNAALKLFPDKATHPRQDDRIWLSGILSCQNLGTGWKIENRHYAITLSLQGSFKELVDKKTGKIIFKDQTVTSSGGLPANSLEDEFEPFITISPDKGRLEFIFRTEIRQRKKLPDYPLTLETKYLFDESDKIQINYTLTAAAGVYPAAKVDWSASTGDVKWTITDLDTTSSQKDDSTKLNLSFLDKSSVVTLYPRIGYQLDLSVAVNENNVSFKRNQSHLPLSFDDDPAFDRQGGRYSVRNHQEVPFTLLNFPAGYWCTYRYRCFLDFSPGNDHSLGLQMHYPDPYLVKNLSPSQLEVGQYALTMTLRGVNLYGDQHSGPIYKKPPTTPKLTNCPLGIELSYWLRDGRKVTVQKEVRLQQGTTQWHSEELNFQVEETGYSPVLRISSKPARDGYLAINQIQLSAVNQGGK